MKKIVKGKEPISLTKHRKSKHSDYNNYADKKGLRESLVKEQRGICCYCMGRIEATEAKMKIEHFLCQSLHPDKELEYNNLFGACLGNMKADAEMHCDTFKGNKEFHFQMCTSGSIHGEIEYKSDGQIFSYNQNLNSELNEVLNLNFHELKKIRKSTLTGFVDFYLNGLKGKLNKEKLMRYRDKWAGNSHADQLQPYCMIVVYYLDKKLATYK